jgi:hypothetical protein
MAKLLFTRKAHRIIYRGKTESAIFLDDKNGALYYLKEMWNNVRIELND